MILLDSRAKIQEKNKSENQIVAAEFAPPKHASKSDISELDVNTSVCYGLVCKEFLF